MADPKKDNWRTKPAFNYEFTDFGECVELAVLEFSKRPSVIFMLLRHDVRGFWLCLPWSQYRTSPPDHPCRSSSVVFRGNFFELRKIAYSLPPDLFSSAKVPESETDPNQDDLTKFDNPALVASPGNGSDPDSNKEPDAKPIHD